MVVASLPEERRSGSLLADRLRRYALGAADAFVMLHRRAASISMITFRAASSRRDSSGPALRGAAPDDVRERVGYLLKVLVSEFGVIIDALRAHHRARVRDQARRSNRGAWRASARGTARRPGPGVSAKYSRSRRGLEWCVGDSSSCP